MNTHAKYDIHHPDSGHFERFQKRLETHRNMQRQNKRRRNRIFLAAAGLTLLLSLGVNLIQLNKKKYDLADVSPKLKATQNYFTASIQAEIKKIHLRENEHNKQVVQDAMQQIEKLENEYDKLGKNLKNTGFDKRIINAMIFNFQKRIEILQNLQDKLETIKTTTHETDKKV